MKATARRLRVVSNTPKPKARKPGTWGPLAEPVDPLETHERAAWTSFLTRGGVRRDHTDMTDLRALAEKIRGRAYALAETLDGRYPSDDIHWSQS